MFRIIGITAAVCAVLVACATPMKSYVFDSSREFSEGKDMIWGRVMSILTTGDIQIKTLEKDSGVVYAEQLRVHASEMEQFADCGTSGFGTIPTGPGTVSFNIFVLESPASGTTVTVNARFVQPVSVYAVIANVHELRECNSKGVLERAMLGSLKS